MLFRRVSPWTRSWIADVGKKAEAAKRPDFLISHYFSVTCIIHLNQKPTKGQFLNCESQTCINSPFPTDFGQSLSLH